MEKTALQQFIKKITRNEYEKCTYLLLSIENHEIEKALRNESIQYMEAYNEGVRSALESTANHKPADSVTKPPIGLMSRTEHLHQGDVVRLESLKGAIGRYVAAGLEIDKEWIDEYLYWIGRLRDRAAAIEAEPVAHDGMSQCDRDYIYARDTQNQSIKNLLKK